ncbi:hypothetical protein B0O99DRAFT_596289 [Bisporella sp. PMI_857]|nr:hypothetical protein B0O99DRAFT_596289 [Bisporella sp. PMI_857]
MEQTKTSSISTLEKKRSLTPETAHEVRTIGIADYEAAALCLAEAFAVDEIARYFVDTEDMSSYSDAYKWKLHLDIMRYITAAHCYKGIVTTVGPDFDAVALWMPPGKNMDDWLTIFRSGLWRLYFQLSREGRARFYSEFVPLLHDTKAEVMGPRDDDSYYLVYIGTKPGSQGKGYARKLIEHMTAKADQEGRATYLESSTHGNVAYYQRYGFVEKMAIEMKRGVKPLPLHIMVREPLAVDAKGEPATVEIRLA